MHPVISRLLKNPIVLYGLLLLGALALAWPAIQTWSDALVRGLWFHLTEDEGFYAEVIQNLKIRGTYGGWEIPPFSPAITGGPAFLLPLAFFSKITGLNTAVAARVGCFLFHLGAVAFFIALSKKIVPQSRSIPILALLIFFLVWRGIPENGYMIFGILAESTVTFYLFASLYFAATRRFFWAGCCACLTVLAKPYMIFFPAAFLGAMVLTGLKANSPTQRNTFLAKMLISLAVPLLLWFVFMATKLGTSGMIQYWLAYPKAVSAFSGTASALSPLDRALLHALHWKEAMSIRAWIFTIVGLGVLVSHGARKKNPDKTVPLICLTFAALHLIWWFFMSPGVTARYLMPVPMVALVGWIYLVKYRIRFLSEKSVIFSPFVFYTVFALLTTAVVVKKVAPEWKKNLGNYDSCQFCRQVYVISAWEKNHSGPELKSVWISTGTHTADRDQLFSAPTHTRRIDTASDLSKIQSGDWVSVSDFTQPFFKTWVSENCVKKINPPLQSNGLWECP